jgi:hypothetical protein
MLPRGFLQEVERGAKSKRALSGIAERLPEAVLGNLVIYLLDESRSSSRFRIDVFYWCFEKEKIRGSRSMNP